MTKTFRSYVDLDDYVGNGSDPRLQPPLLPGEVVRAAADDVLLYLPLAEQIEGVRGRLTVTNFKLAFVETRDHREKTGSLQRNQLIGQHDVCLANVDTIHQLLSSSGKIKLLAPRSTVSGKIKGIQIRCKDFRLFTFSFHLSSVNEDNDVTNALLWLCYPRSVGQLFAFHYQDDTAAAAAAAVPELDSPAYWKAELERTGCLGWRVSHANELYQMCRSLPQVLVVPKGLFDADLVTASGHFRERRLPIWCWGNEKGAAIVRSAYTHSDLRQSPEERRVLDSIRACHPFLREPTVLDVGAACPSVEELQDSYWRLRQLCSPDSASTFESSDGRFLGQLGGCRWMSFVSRCLAAAQECVDTVTDRGTVCVLTESTGRDLTAAVSCLAQLLLEPSCRTRVGFEQLVQREWVLLGHPFQERFGLVYIPDGKKGPVFLLFLDCVHQLLEQHPDRFEFTDTYLVSLWDSLFVPVFDTFLFNCQKQRADALTGRELSAVRPLCRRPVWHWGLQFSAAEQELFVSALYQARAQLRPTELRPGPLSVTPALPLLPLWTLAFCRWVPHLHARRAGRPAQQARLRQLVSRLQQLNARLESARAGVVVRQRPAPPPPLALPGSLAPFAAGPPAAGSSRLLGVSSGFVNTLLRGSIVTAEEEDGGTLRRQYGS